MGPSIGLAIQNRDKTTLFELTSNIRKRAKLPDKRSEHNEESDYEDYNQIWHQVDIDSK